MVRHPKLIAWERKLKQLFERIDVYLEKTYGATYPLHPARRKHGTTCSRKQDGLFRVGAAFSAGYGSDHGAGYIVRVDMITLKKVPTDVRDKIEKDVARQLKKELKATFPGRSLHVDQDGRHYKIHGDLHLGKA